MQPMQSSRKKRDFPLNFLMRKFSVNGQSQQIYGRISCILHDQDIPESLIIVEMAIS